MVRQIFWVSILSSLLVLSGCTSGTSKDDSSVAEADAGDDLAFDSTTSEGSASADFADGTTGESLPEGTVGEAAKDEQQIGSLKELSSPNEMDSLPPAAPETLAEVKDMAVVAKPVLPLKKIETAPFEKNGKWLNAVYLARDGDTLKSVSQKIYGTEDRHKDLKAWNPSAKKKLKIGEKVYYNSPNRLDDQQRMMVYYEDVGIAPTVYAAKEGDDLKKLANDWIGHRDSWKELFATNMTLEEKGKLTPGTELRYWPNQAGGQAIAQAGDSKMGGAAGTVGTPNGGMGGAPGTPDNMGQMMPGDMNDPMKQGGMAMNDPNDQLPPIQETLPPPPPPAAMEPPLPPPPPPPMEAPSKKGGLKEAGFSPDEMVTIAGGALILIALVVLIVIRRNRARATRMDFTQQTQV